MEGQYALDLLYDRVPAALLQTEIDTCWVNVAGEDPAAYVKKYAGRAPLVHLKDFVLKGRKPAHMYDLIGLEEVRIPSEEEGDFAYRPLGQGMQDVPSILAALEQTGTKWDHRGAGRAESGHDGSGVRPAEHRLSGFPG